MPSFYNLMNITETSRKDEVITAACELVDQQDAVIKGVKDKQKTLFVLLTITTTLYFIPPWKLNKQLYPGNKSINAEKKANAKLRREQIPLLDPLPS